MRYHDSKFRAAQAAGARTPAEVAAHVGCSVATARRRGHFPDPRKMVTPGAATLRRIAERRPRYFGDTQGAFRARSVLLGGGMPEQADMLEAIRVYNQELIADGLRLRDVA